jgi:ATP-binding cassette subfamily C exporter for protease/lipase
MSSQNTPGGSSLPELTPLRNAINECKRAFGLMIFVTFVINVLSIAPILYMMNVFDRVLPTRSMVTLWSLLVLVLSIYIFWTALEWMRTRILTRISLRVDWELASDIFNACFRKGLTQQDSNVHLSMQDMMTLRQFMSGSTLLALIDTPFALIFVLVAYIIHPALAAFIAASIFILFLITLYTKKVTSGPIKAASQYSQEANRMAASSLQHSELALAMGMLPLIRNKWHEKHRAYLHHQINATEANNSIGMLGGVFAKALPSLQISLAVVLAGLGLISAGGVIAASFLITKAVTPVKTLINRWEDLVKARMAFDRLDALLVNERRLVSKMELPAPIGRLTADNLELVQTEGGDPILQGINFELPAGKILAVLGPNAAGKSSLLKLILGVWRPTSGHMRLDGAEVSDWRHEHLGQYIGYVSQRISLFEATIAENIARLAQPDPKMVVEAAQLAGVHEMILAMPNGYDTRIGQPGFELSGGQAQRLTVARAFYGSPKLIVLDEPNSNMDEVAESKLIAGLKLLSSKGSTVVLTTHRAKLVHLSDYVLLLRNGRQVRFGPSSQVLPEISGQPVTPGRIMPAKPADGEQDGKVA